jgi:hypothetical protein
MVGWETDRWIDKQTNTHADRQAANNPYTQLAVLSRSDSWPAGVNVSMV